VQDGSKTSLFSMVLHLCPLIGRAGVDVSVNGSPMGVAEAYEGSWQTVRLARGFPLAPGKNRIVHTAVHGPVLVEWLYVAPMEVGEGSLAGSPLRLYDVTSQLNDRSADPN